MSTTPDDSPRTAARASTEELLAAASPRPWYFDGWDVFSTGATDGTGGHRLVFPLPHPTWHPSQRVSPADAELAVRAVNEYEALLGARAAVPAPEHLHGADGESAFVRRDVVSTATEARAYLFAQSGSDWTGVEPDEVEMLPVPEHFIELEVEWAVVNPATPGAVAYWRFEW